MRAGITCTALAPASCLSEHLARDCNPSVTSLILASDAIPRLSYFTVEGLLHELALASPAKQAAIGLGNRIASVCAPIVRAWKGNPVASGPPAPPQSQVRWLYHSQNGPFGQPRFITARAGAGAEGSEAQGRCGRYISLHVAAMKAMPTYFICDPEIYAEKAMLTYFIFDPDVYLRGSLVPARAGARADDAGA